MIKLKLNGISHYCVSSYEEMKVRHFLKILKWDRDKDIADRDYFKLLCILTDTEYTAVERSVDNDSTIINAVGWIITQQFKFSETPPKAIEIRGKKIDIPEDISELSIGQSIHLRRDYIEKSEMLEENIAIATAIYLQPLVDGGKFNLKKAIVLSKEIEDMPVNLIYPIGFFLLKRALNFGQMPVNLSLLERISQSKRLRRMWRTLLRFIGYRGTMIFH
jgi:hypothetical protein